MRIPKNPNNPPLPVARGAAIKTKPGPKPKSMQIRNADRWTAYCRLSPETQRVLRALPQNKSIPIHEAGELVRAATGMSPMSVAQRLQALARCGLIEFRGKAGFDRHVYRANDGLVH